MSSSVMTNEGRAEVVSRLILVVTRVLRQMFVLERARVNGVLDSCLESTVQNSTGGLCGPTGALAVPVRPSHRLVF